MKLHKALKLKKSLTGEIAKLKKQIAEKNSYLVGSLNGEKFDVNELYDELMIKTDELIGLKFAINEANREIQSQLYVIAEYKGLIEFWNGVDVTEGKKSVGFSENSIREYKVHIDEKKKNEIIAKYQSRIDSLQEEIDTFNYTTDIPWEKAPVENSK